MDAVNAIRFENAGDAVQHVDASGVGTAILLNGRPMVVNEADADSLAAAGIEFAYLCGYQERGRIMTVPVN